jgi:hypothetical protein
MAKNDALKLLTSEFNLWGVRFDHRERGSGHIELRWQATPDKEVRSYIVAKTPGDHRGWLNARADIRKLFRQDGLTLKEEKQAKPSVLRKALELPKPVEPDLDQLKMLRAEIADLTDLVLELAARLDQPHMMVPIPSHTVLAPTSELPMPMPHVAIKPPSYRSVNAIEYVSEGWTSTAGIAKSMNVPENIAYRKLYYLMTKGMVEKTGERWRRVATTGMLPLTNTANEIAA